jgi:hypothetical protein
LRHPPWSLPGRGKAPGLASVSAPGRRSVEAGREVPPRPSPRFGTWAPRFGPRPPAASPPATAALRSVPTSVRSLRSLSWWPADAWPASRCHRMMRGALRASGRRLIGPPSNLALLQTGPRSGGMSAPAPANVSDRPTPRCRTRDYTDSRESQACESQNRYGPLLRSSTRRRGLSFPRFPFVPARGGELVASLRAVCPLPSLRAGRSSPPPTTRLPPEGAPCRCGLRPRFC